MIASHIVGVDPAVRQKKRILVPIGCRSDEGLSAPVIKRLQEHFDVFCPQLVPQDFSYSYSRMEVAIKCLPRPDLVLITGDRVEMCAAAAAAFHNKVKIAHFYAGVVNDPITTFDDVDRHCITLWSDIQFCENEEACWRAWDMKRALGIEAYTWDVGISHLDDLEIDERKVPTVPYDLLLLNNEPLSNTQWERWGKTGFTVQITGNPDGKTPSIPLRDGGVFLNNLPRPQFLGLLKNCQRFITNSSAAIYEAPHFLKPEQIVMIGDRNRNRPRGPFKTGASDRIVEILKEYLK